MQAASGLAAAHAQGLVHRDIKPSNILLENGVERVKITDFGLARSADDASLTQSGVVFGTPQYMSPEQARGEPVDHRADLFSLGCVLYAMGTGRSPFRAETSLAVLRRVCEDRPRPLRDLNPDVPDWLENIVMKLLAKEPADRFRSAVEVAGLLERCLAHLQQPKQNPLPELPEPLAGDRKGGRRRAVRRLLVALALAGVLAASGALVIRLGTAEGTLVVEVDDPAASVQVDDQYLVITGIGPREFRLRTGPHRVTATSGNTGRHDEVVTIVKDGKTVVRVRREPPAPGGAVAGDAPVDPALPKSPRLIRELQVRGGPVRGVSFLPGKLTALTAMQDGAMWIWDIRSAWELYNFRAEGHRIRTLAIVPQGRALTGGEDGSIVLWSLPGNREIRRFRGHEGAVRAISHPRGTHQFVSAGEDGTVRLWDLDSGEEIRRLRGHRGGVLALDLTGDRLRLLTGGEDGTVRLWDLSNGRDGPGLRGREGGRPGTGRRAQLTPCRLRRRRPARVYRRHRDRVGRPRHGGTYRPDRGPVGRADWRHVLSLSEDGTLRVWDLIKYQQRGRAEVPGHATVLDVAHGSRLALTGGDDGSTRLWLIPLRLARRASRRRPRSSRPSDRRMRARVGPVSSWSPCSETMTGHLDRSLAPAEDGTRNRGRSASLFRHIWPHHSRPVQEWTSPSWANGQARAINSSGLPCA